MATSSRNASFLVSSVCLLLIFALSDCRESVINVGDSFTIECPQEKRDNFPFDPTLDFMTPNSERWDTLFTGGSPRPETNLAEWKLGIQESDPKVFVYTIKSATPANGGQYKCDNIEDTFFDLTVVDPNSMECPKLPDELNIGETIDPKCSLQKSGPADLNIKWFLRGEEMPSGDDNDGTFDRVSSKMEMALKQSHNGQDLVCQYEGADGKPQANCSLILNVLIPVSLGEIEYRVIGEASSEGNKVTEDSTENKVVCEIPLYGNPPPNADDIDIRPDGVVEKLETRRNKDGSMVVEITYTSPKEDIYLNFTYAGEFLNNILIKPFNLADENQIDEGDGESSGAAVAIGCICGLLVLVIIGAILVLFLRKNLGKSAEKAENEEETKKLDSVEKGETQKEENLQNNTDDQTEESEEKEKLTKIEDVEPEEKKDGEKIETKDVGKHDGQPPNAEDQKE